MIGAPLGFLLIGPLTEAGAAGIAVVVIAIVAWTVAIVTCVALSLRRNEPEPEPDRESIADSLALDLDDPERAARVARSDDDADLLRRDDPPNPSIPPYLLP